MPLKTLVKVGNITNLSDARYCAGMGVEMLGFSVLEDQENYIATTLFQQIRGWVSGPKVVAEMYGLKTSHDIGTLLQNYAPDFIEFSFDEYMAFKSYFTLPFIVSLSVNDAKKTIGDHPHVHYWIIDEMEMASEDLIAPVLLKINSKENFEAIIANQLIKGVSLSGSPEIRPGFKNYDDLSVVLEALDEN